MVLEAVPVDFGNGIVAYTRPRTGAPAYLEKGHEGFHAPELDVLVTEHAVGDGGSIGRTRALARHLRATISHKHRWTRRQLLQAFSPGVERVLSTPLASLPYYVQAIEFPESLWASQFRFTVNLVSPLAYPVGAPRSASTGGEPGGGIAYPFAYPYTYDSVQAVESFGVESGAEVATPVRIAATLTLDASDVVFSIGGRATRIVGELTAGDVLVVDPTPSSPVVTVNGENRLSWFDAASEWPALEPGYSEISSSVLAQMVVQWRPRMLGLL